MNLHFSLNFSKKIIVGTIILLRSPFFFETLWQSISTKS
jgi:hypothetical protein